MTLVCAYFGAWEVTKRFLPGSMQYFEGTKGDLQKSGQQLCQVINADSPAPFIITRNEIELVRKQHPGYEPYIQPTHIRRGYYVWFFGMTMKLPIESAFQPPFEATSLESN